MSTNSSQAQAKMMAFIHQQLDAGTTPDDLLAQLVARHVERDTARQAIREAQQTRGQAPSPAAANPVATQTSHSQQMLYYIREQVEAGTTRADLLQGLLDQGTPTDQAQSLLTLVLGPDKNTSDDTPSDDSLSEEDIQALEELIETKLQAGVSAQEMIDLLVDGGLELLEAQRLVFEAKQHLEE